MSRLRFVVVAPLVWVFGNHAPAQFPLVANRAEQRPDRATIEAYPAFAFYRVPAVVDELKLAAGQRERLAAIPDEVLTRYRDEIAKFEADERAVTETVADDKAARERDIQRRLDDLLAKYLTDDTRKRARQIAIQSAGVNAFRDRDVVFALRLSDDQKKAVADALPKRTTVARKDDDPSTVDGLLKQLTAGQKAKWDELVGPPLPKPGNARNTLRVTIESFDSVALQFWLNPNPLVTSGTSALWKELALEAKAATDLRNDLRLLQQAYRPERRPLPRSSPERSKLIRTLTTTAVERANAVLTTEQKTRVGQIRKQFRGFDAISVPSVLTAMSWTPGQSAGVAKLTAAIDGKTQRLRSDPVDESAIGPRYVNGVPSLVESLAAVRAALTPAQRTTYDAVYGPLLSRERMESIADSDRSVVSEYRVRTLTWSPDDAWARHGRSMTAAASYAESRAAFEESLRLNPENRSALTGLVTLLAACPDDTVRNGAAALKWARTITTPPDKAPAEWLDSLAMAYAETGRFAEAVATQKAAIDRQKAEPAARLALPGFERISPYEKRLKAYESGEPYRLPTRERP